MCCGHGQGCSIQQRSILDICSSFRPYAPLYSIKLMPATFIPFFGFHERITTTGRNLSDRKPDTTTERRLSRSAAPIYIFICISHLLGVSRRPWPPDLRHQTHTGMMAGKIADIRSSSPASPYANSQANMVRNEQRAIESERAMSTRIAYSYL